MTSEEIRATIERLKALSSGCRIYTSTEVVNAVSSGDWVGGLIEVLEQADPDTHVELPRDADGLTWHIGDAIEDGTVLKELMLTKYEWNLVGVPAIDPSTHRHYQKTTVEDVLREFGDEVKRCCDTENTIAEYAARLREAMRDE